MIRAREFSALYGLDEAAEPATKPRADERAIVQRGVQEVALRLLRDGPKTASELGSMLYPDANTMQRSSNTSYVMRALYKKGLAEKRECPVTRLDKWFAKGVA